VQPDVSQRAALRDLEDAFMQAGRILTAGCSAPRRLAAPERLESMETRLRAVLRAKDVIEPALAAFYDLLRDEQKECCSRMQS
jgi:LTXXQ motif family protein